MSAAALNAGIGQGGAFLDNNLADVLEIIDLNVTSTVHLAKRLLPDMVARNDGRVLITSSDRLHDAGFIPSGLQRLEVLPPVLRRGAAGRAEGHRESRSPP
ncbi:MAG: SDR family NAD(P)-dependent oxidoreductase [Geodermatophilaceae bacterium]